MSSDGVGQTTFAEYLGMDTESSRPRVLSDGRVECHECGKAYKRIVQHWSMSSTCNHALITEYQMSLLLGMMLGDGSIKSSDVQNPCVRMRMINKPFLDWLDGELGWLSTGVRLDKTAEQSAEHCRNSGFRPNARAENYHDLYYLQTRSHPDLAIFEEWYDSGSIVFPTDIVPDRIAMRMWYVSDGSLCWQKTQRPHVKITSQNEQNRPEAIVSYFEQHGFSVSQSGSNFYLSVDQTPQFLDWLGTPPPGFEYKWCLDSYDEYHRLKDLAYDC